MSREWCYIISFSKNKNFHIDKFVDDIYEIVNAQDDMLVIVYSKKKVFLNFQTKKFTVWNYAKKVKKLLSITPVKNMVIEFPLVAENI